MFIFDGLDTASADKLGPNLNLTNADNGKMQRRHDLDALRAIAMLLGIVLHAALSFAPGLWMVSDSQQSGFYNVLSAVIHGFRMPLFFLISGFFTAMLWRKRGLAGMLIQRAKRILIPLVLGCLTIVPTMLAVDYFVRRPAESVSDAGKIFDAAAAGDSEAVRLAIESGSVSIDALHPTTRGTLLTVATFCGHPETVKTLLDLGADVNLRNADSGTPLHVAAFMGRAESAKLLVAAGAELTAKDVNGKTPADNLQVDFATTNFIAQIYGLTVNEDELTAGRKVIAQLIGLEKSAVAESKPNRIDINALYGLFFQLPVFMHLWFLAFLCWLILAFVAYAAIARGINFATLPNWLFCSPLSLLWLVPLTMVPQFFMMPFSFGTDPSVGLLPIPSVIGYYAIFYFFGAVYWDLNDRDGLLGRWWYVTLPVALFVVFPIGLEIVSGAFGFGIKEMLEEWTPMSNPVLVGNFLQALFVWLMIFGLIGMFRALLSRESKALRYISDSSYWLYLAHLPLVILAQWFVKDYQVPAAIKFVGITVVVSVFLLLTYEYLVRYTFIGAVLNGKRSREA